jgi:hypothetical protein
MTVAMSSGCTASSRSSTACSSVSAPAETRSSSAPDSICQTSRRSGASVRTSPTVLAWAGVSTITATAPESLRIHCTCSAEDVS